MGRQKVQTKRVKRKPRRVWVLYLNHPVDGVSLLGVFGTEERALKRYTSFQGSTDWRKQYVEKPEALVVQ